MKEEKFYFGKDCPIGLVQVEFVGGTGDQYSKYGWKPSKVAWIDLSVDGNLFRVELGNVLGTDGITRRGLHIFRPIDFNVRCDSINTTSIVK